MDHDALIDETAFRLWHVYCRPSGDLEDEYRAMWNDRSSRHYELRRLDWRNVAREALRIAAYNAAKARGAELVGADAPSIALPPAEWGGVPA